MNRVKFIVAEPSYLIRKGLVSIINRIEYATVVKETDNLENINSMIVKYDPDFLAFNFKLFVNLKPVRRHQLKIDLLLKGIAINISPLTGQNLINTFRECINLNDSKEEIYDKINALVLSGHTDRHFHKQLNYLSEREKTILKLVARGMTNKEIADRLFLSVHTVITHRKNITGKIGIKTISGLTVYAILRNIISLEELKS
jgi:DNA-binding CsgD family transcriptional regulator